MRIFLKNSSRTERLTQCVNRQPINKFLFDEIHQLWNLKVIRQCEQIDGRVHHLIRFPSTVETLEEKTNLQSNNNRNFKTNVKIKYTVSTSYPSIGNMTASRISLSNAAAKTGECAASTFRLIGISMPEICK
jgi:hypothetical protein